MKTTIIGKAATRIAATLLMAILSVADVQAWNWATHAYIDDHLGKRNHFENMNEMYGSTAPDLFYNVFNHSGLSAMTHHDFIKVWNAAWLPLDKASAFGFVSHNDNWGADWTAHEACTSCGVPKGYVVMKAEELMNSVKLPDQLIQLNQDHPEIFREIIREISHNFVEAGVDILIKRLDHNIGKKLASAALLRSPGFPLLLVKAYAHDVAEDLNMNSVDAVKFIIAAEKEFRKSMILYGQALMQDDATAVQLLSEQLASLATDFLGAYGITLDKLGITETEVSAFANEGIEGAIFLCKDDYRDEIEGTIDVVRANLEAKGFSY